MRYGRAFRVVGRSRPLVPALTGLGLGLAVLGPGLAPGFVLSYDMVFVPDPSFTPMTFGLTGTVPRHVPSDVFVTALASVVPADAAQKLVLLAVFVMACASAASLVPSRRLLPRLAAGVCYTWNPFVAERLLLGQWALLLGYAALPWVLAAATGVNEPGGSRRLVRALVPAAIGGFAALTVSAIAALTAALVTGRTRAGLRVVAVVAVLSLPWLVPGLLRPAGMPEDGGAVEVFAARADTPFGTLGSLLSLGGVWNSETVPVGYGNPLSATFWLLLVLAALAAHATGLRRGAEAWSASRGIAAAGVAGFAVAAFGAVAAPVLEGMVDLWPGFAVLRDGQQYVAPLAVVVAVGLGTAADRAAGARLPLVPTGAVLAPLLLLPTLAWGAAGHLRAVDYPADWARARQIIEDDPAPGDVLVLPWASYRSYPWNHDRRVLDPLPRYLRRRVIVNDAVTVQRAGEAVTVRPEDPRAVRLGRIIASGAPDAAALRLEGVRYVVFDAEISASHIQRATTLLRSADLVVYRIDGTSPAHEARVSVAPVVTVWVTVGAVVLWSILTAGISLSLPLLGSIRSITPRHPRRRAE
ncbi:MULTISPECIES: hypothetical protein [Actinomadura]|uniref:Uncharacterized protein n=1 Tax=Actinomadura litoris TaxID=2678616 RepID=A0A7K1KWV1_9ACTN|nr:MULTISPECIES: hypothetical protein [Actinomadura]MBT2210778.1 hypothetical protein [Actinomadura sp. NEAU-AAG7]MUN36678.1 hypothetical protein [Actinomadura litoris]